MIVIFEFPNTQSIKAMMKGMNAYFELENYKKGTKLTTIFEYHMSNTFGDILNRLKIKKMNKKSWSQFLGRSSIRKMHNTVYK